MSKSHLLPYYNKAEEEEHVRIYLTMLEENMQDCLNAGIPSFEWLNSMEKLIRLDFNIFQVENFNLLKIGKCLYDIVFQNNLFLTPKLLASFAVFFQNDDMDILDDYKPKDLEYRAGGDEILLDWKLAYNRIKRILEGKFVSEENSLSLLSPLLNVVRRTNRYYARTATKEILEEFIPMMNGLDFDSFCLYSALMCEFLPATANPTLSNSSSSADDSYFYIPALFALWERTRNSMEIDYFFISLFARLSKECKSIIFSDDQIRFIFLKAAPMLQLPIGKEIQQLPSLFQGIAGVYGSVISLMSLLPEDFAGDPKTPWAKLIVYNLERSVTIECLKDIVSQMHVYAHPANAGNWSCSIFSLVHGITGELLRRWNNENSENSMIPVEQRLSFTVVEHVTILLLPLLLFGIFGKDSDTLDLAQVSIKHLCWLCPNIVFPALIPKIVPALETLTESHRTASALTTLCLISPALLRKGHAPGAVQHFITFLHLTLPGLDSNDANKTYYTSLFYAHAMMFVPIADCSNMSPVSIDFPIRHQLEYSSCLASTSGFSNWLEKLIDQLFSLYRNLPDTYSNPNSSSTNQAGSKEDDYTLQRLEFIAEIVFSQLSDELNDMALSLLLKHIQSQVIPVAAESVASLVSLVSPRNKKKRLETFLPLCEDRIRQEIEVHGAGTRITSSSNLPQGYGSMSDATLHWFQEIFHGTLRGCGAEIIELGLQNRIETLIDLMLANLVSQRGFLLTCAAIATFVDAVATTYPINHSSLTLKEWETLDINIDLWGKSLDVHQLQAEDFEWHKPSPEEAEIASRIASKYIDMSMANLNRLMLDPNRPYLETLKWINVFHFSLQTMHIFLRPQPSSVNESESDDSYYYRYPIQGPIMAAGYLFNDPNDPAYIYWKGKIAAVHEFLCRLSTYFLVEKNQSDTESVQNLCGCIEELFTFDFQSSGIANVLSQWSPFLRIRKNPSTVPRYLRVIKLHVLYLFRLRNAKRQEWLSPDLKKLCLLLVDFSISRFRKIRIDAQGRLSRIMLARPDMELPCLQKAAFSLLTCPLVSVRRAQEDDCIVKGSLYILGSWVKFTCAAKFNTEFMLLYLKALLRWATAKVSLEDSLMSLLVSCMTGFIQAFNFSGFGMSVPPEMKSEVTTNSHLSALAVRMVEKTKTLHVEMVDYLLTLPDDCHWKVTTTIVQLLHELVTPEFPIHEAMVILALKNCMHENQSIRKHSVFLIVLILKTLKKRSKSTGQYLVDTYRVREIVKREDPEFKLIKKGWLDWESPDRYFCDELLYGFIAWPKEFKIFKGFLPLTTESGPTCQDSASSSAIAVLRESVQSEFFWSEFVKVAGIEPETDDELSMPDFSNIMFITRLVTQFREGMIDSLLAAISPLLDRSDETHCQKAVVEIIASVYLGSKHFSPRLLEKLDLQFHPLILKGLQNCTTESLPIWKYLFDTLFTYRDPKRMLSFIRGYFATIQDSEQFSFFALSKQLTLLYSLCGSGKVSPVFLERIFVNLLDFKTSPYGEIREMVASILDKCLYHISRLQYDNMESFVIAARQGKLRDYSAHPLLLKSFCIDSTSDKSNIVNTSKTALKWMDHALCSWNATSTLPYVSVFLDLIPSFGVLNDSDLFEMIDVTLGLFPFLPQSPSTAINVATQLQTLLSLDSYPGMDSEQVWHFKVRFLHVLEKFFSTNIFILPRRERDGLITVACDLLGDTNLEVRQMAALKLTTLIRCSSINTIESLKTRFLTVLNENRIIRIRGQERGPEYYSTVQKRHSAVLGLCSIILSFPYNMPDVVPVCVVAVSKCVSDPSPIQGYVRKLFVEFKSTHQETWDEDKTKFSEEELYIISDLLISPSYYA